MAVATLILPGADAAPKTESYVTLGLSDDLDAERVLTGTVNQVAVADGGANGAVTLSTPQDIHSGASPTFAALILSGSSTPIFSFTAIDPGASVEVGRFVGSSVSPADQDEIFIPWRLNNDGLSAHEYARMTAIAADVSAGSEDGALEFDVSQAGVLRSMLKLEYGTTGLGSVTVNPDARDVNFSVVVESGVTLLLVDGQSDGIFRLSGAVATNLFRADATINAVAIGASPSSATIFSIEGGAANRAIFSGIARGMNFAGDTYTSTNPGTFPISALVGFDIQTFAATGATTLTDAPTVYIEGPPAAGANVTITNALALWIDSGDIRFDGELRPETQQTYSVTNALTDRSYDADTVTVAELADVVATLIADIRTIGLVL